jgi:hypothetical protein
MKRKCLAVGIILLFVGTCIIPAIAQDTEKPLPASRGNWLYVGGSGPGNYTHIQDAINDSQNGDTIYVYAGIYSNITICKSLRLIGENKHTTIISGSGIHNAVSVEANQITICGFTVQNGGPLGMGFGISIQDGRMNITISDMILTQNNMGIINSCNINLLLDNITFTANGEGISCNDGKNCTITHCIFSNDDGGIYINDAGLSPSTSGALDIKNNLFLHNSVALALSVCTDTYGNTTVEGNSFQHNYYDIMVETCKGVNILKNNFINSNRHVVLARDCFIREIPVILFYKQHWMNNYWDDWNHKQRYAIHGHWTLYIAYYLDSFPIFRFPYKEYDPNPAQEPYDIHGMR